jgi:hypothetical protein
MQLSEKCDAIRRADQYGYDTTFAYERHWAVNAPPACGTLRLIMVTVHKSFCFVENAFHSFARLIDNPDFRPNKPNPASAGDPTMAKTPVVPLQLPNSMIVPVGWQHGSPANQNTAELSSMRANGGLCGNDKVLYA